MSALFPLPVPSLIRALKSRLQVPSTAAVTRGASRAVPASRAEVEFSAVVKEFDSNGKRHRALDNVSFDVAPGQIFGIVGRSGAGKSTLLRMINGLEAPSSGTVRVAGVDVASLDRRELSELRKRSGMIFQHFNLLSSKTAFQNIALPLVVSGVSRAQVESRTNDLLKLVGLADKGHAFPSQLSGGQKQRVGIARALVHHPRLLMCDEATSALDQESTQSILKLLRSIRDEMGLTIVLITHQIEVVQEICDRVAVISDGRISEIGSTWQVLGDHRNPSTAAMLHRSETHIPHSLAARLQQEIPNGAFQSVVSLKYTGDSSGSVGLGVILQAFGPYARLLYGGIEHVQEHAYGRLLIGVPNESDRTDLLLRARSLCNSAEVLGYVASSS